MKAIKWLITWILIGALIGWITWLRDYKPEEGVTVDDLLANTK